MTDIEFLQLKCIRRLATLVCGVLAGLGLNYLLRQRGFSNDIQTMGLVMGTFFVSMVVRIWSIDFIDTLYREECDRRTRKERRD